MLLSILLITLAAWLYFHKKEIKCLRIQANDQFQEISPNFFVSKDTPPDTIALLTRLREQSLSELQVFWSSLQSNSTIIYCHTKKLYEQYGMPGTPACNLLGRFAIISKYGVHQDVMSHELCHSEIFSRIGENYFTYYYRLPCWLDEGIALQFDHRALYPRSALDTIGPLDLEELRQIDRPQDFYLKDYQQTTQHYMNAKVAVERFINVYSKEAIVQLLENFRKGGDIYQLYKDN